MIVDKNKNSPIENSSIRQALPQILAVCVKNVLLLAFGMTLGFPTILIPNLSGNDPYEKISMGQEAISWIGSINLICVPVGCLLSGSITQYLGRKRAMQIVNIPFVMAWLLLHYSTQDWEIFLGLAVTGLAGGLLEAPVLTYVAEITQPHLRGILSSTSTMSVSLGILCEFLLGTFLPWRSLVLVNCSIPILSIVLLNFVPETPVWLLSRQRDEEARQSIAWLRGWTTVENVELEYQELRKELKHDEERRKCGKMQALKLLGKKNFLWPYTVVAFAFFLGSFNGTQTLQTYAIRIFAITKAPINKYYATVLVGVVQLLGCTFCAILINIIGKRILNFISVLGAGVCFFITATYIYYMDVKYFDKSKMDAIIEGQEEFHWIPVSFLVLSSFFSYIGLKMLPWILIGEVYSNEIRATAAGISGGTGYIFGFIANKIFLSMVASITLPGVFWVSSLVGILGTAILYFVLPETEGKSLYEITEHFASRSKLSNSVRRTKSVTMGQSNPGFQSDENGESKL